MSSPSISYLDTAQPPGADARYDYALSRRDLDELALPLAPYALPRRTVTAMAAVFIAYLGTAQAVHYLFPTSITPALIWPPAGIALAGMFLGGYAVWPAIALASLANAFLNASPIGFALVIAAANVAQAFIGTWILRRFNFNPQLSRLSDALSVLFVSIATTLVVPVVSIALLSAAHGILPGGDATSALGNWWTGEILSVLVLMPFLALWIRNPRFSRSQQDWIEAGAAFAALVVLDVLIFWTPYSSIHGVSLVYILLLPLFWLALRVGPRGMTLALLLNCGLAIGGSLVRGAAAAQSLGYRLFEIEIFTITISFIFLLIVSIAEERKRTTDALALHVRQLEDAVARIRKEDDAKSRFIATLAHELRNPLAPLLSSLELLNADPAKSDETRAAASDMEQHVQTMRHLLDDLLDISRISRGKLTLQMERVELHGVTERSVRTVQSLMDARGHLFSVSAPEGSILLEADPVRLEQVIVNLLNNAAKYTEPGGTIDLIIEKPHPDAVRIRVKDTGIGIRPEVQHRIFEPFLQLEEDSRKLAGLGIGLSLTKNLVDMHNGTITVRSEGVGRGSEFIVELPLTNLAAPEAPPAEAENALKNRRVLIVDDNRAAADALGKLLRHSGHAVDVAYSGMDALAEAARTSPDVILLDIGMPEMDGHETARRLRANGYPAVLIALTGYGQDSDRRLSQEAGFNHHLTKPVGLAEIEEVFAEIPLAV